MPIGQVIFWIALVVGGLYVVVLYNGLVTLKHGMSKAWSNIDVLLKQRHDEIPKLVEVAKQYMAFEKDTLERVTKARSAVHAATEQGNVAQVGAAETALRQGLTSIYALAENYPELKANANFQHLRQRISELENTISDRREFYNDSVNSNNVRLEQFPDLVLTRVFGFKPGAMLEFAAPEKADVDIKALFNT